MLPLICIVWLFIGWCFQGWLLAEAEVDNDDLPGLAILVIVRLLLTVIWPIAWLCDCVPSILRFINNLSSHPLGFFYNPGYYLHFWLKANKEEKKE